MDAKLTAVAGSPPRGSVDRTVAARAVILAFGAAVAALAGLVFVRRISGALEQPAPVAPLVATAIAVGTYAFLSRYLSHAIDPPRQAGPGTLRSDALIAWAPAVAIVLLTFGLSWPFARFIDWLVWIPLWIAEVAWHTPFRTFQTSRRQHASNNPRAFDQSEMTSVAAIDGSELDEAGTQSVTIQQLTRIRDADRQESIVGTLRAEFLPGQRTTEVYVGFCPPFDGPPSVQVEQSDGPPARLTVAQVVPHGARIEVKLHEPRDSAEAVLVDLYAGG